MNEQPVAAAAETPASSGDALLSPSPPAASSPKVLATPSPQEAREPPPTAAVPSMQAERPAAERQAVEAAAPSPDAPRAGNAPVLPSKTFISQLPSPVVPQRTPLPGVPRPHQPPVTNGVNAIPQASYGWPTPLNQVQGRPVDAPRQSAQRYVSLPVLQPKPQWVQPQERTARDDQAAAWPDTIEVHDPVRHTLPSNARHPGHETARSTEPSPAQSHAEPFRPSEGSFQGENGDAMSHPRHVPPAERRDPLSDLAGRAINQLTGDSQVRTIIPLEGTR